MPPYLTLNVIRYGSRVKWGNPGKGVTPFPTTQCSSYWKGAFRSLWTMVANNFISSGHPKKYDNKIELKRAVFSALSDHLHIDWENWMNVSHTKFIQPHTHSLMPTTHIFNTPMQICPGPYMAIYIYIYLGIIFNYTYMYTHTNIHVMYQLICLPWYAYTHMHTYI